MYSSSARCVARDFFQTDLLMSPNEIITKLKSNRRKSIQSAINKLSIK